MPSFRKRYESKQKKDAIQTMKNVIKMIESGDYKVEECGLWPGLDGKQNLKVVVKESQSNQVLDQSE